MPKVLGEAVSSITNLDSKVLKSFINVFNPGFLTLSYISGRRQPYMKPFQIFILANLVFFIFLVNSDILRVPSQYFFQMKNSAPLLERKLEEKNMDRTVLAAKYDAKSSNLTKGLVVIIIPFIGLGSYFINFKKGFTYGKHIILATHFLSYFLLACVMLMSLFKILLNLFPDTDIGQRVIQLSITSLIIVYFIIAIKKYSMIKTNKTPSQK